MTTATPSMSYWRRRVKQGPLTDTERAELRRACRVARSRGTTRVRLLFFIAFLIAATISKPAIDWLFR